MPSLPGRSGRPTSSEHQAAVSRRLDLLRAELSGDAGPEPADTWSPAADGDPPWWSSATRVPGARLRVVRPDETGEHAAPEHIFGPPAPVPVPGRHASRRAAELTGWVPDTLRGRVTLGPAQVSVVAVLVAVGLAVTTWSVVRARPEPVAASVEPVAASRDAAEPLVELPASPGAVAVTGAEATPVPPVTTLTVDVAGRVRRPGIAVLDPGARVVDALAAAGGARSGVDLSSLNLARPLVDGEQILVGVPAPAGVAASALAAPAPGAAAQVAGALVNLNTADEAGLDTLPDVGPVTAASIIGWREEHGGFTSVDELLEIDGIGEATLAKIAPHATV